MTWPQRTVVVCGGLDPAALVDLTDGRDMVFGVSSFVDKALASGDDAFLSFAVSSDRPVIERWRRVPRLAGRIVCFGPRRSGWPPSVLCFPRARHWTVPDAPVGTRPIPCGGCSLVPALFLAAEHSPNVLVLGASLPEDKFVGSVSEAVRILLACGVSVAWADQEGRRRLAERGVHVPPH